ncbi:HNH endonuclease [Puniceibacterium sp. IMCC21224]|nr:HNH endonuclease [Puniceibacterium sp. IMCC21224]
MSKAIFIQNSDSIYADRPGEVYNFPKMYLEQVRETIGDWVIFYESGKGAFGYVAVQKVADVIEDPSRAGWYFAVMDRSTLWGFERVVPRLDPVGLTFESMLRDVTGKPFRAGANTLAVRRLPDTEFAAIINAGLRPLDMPVTFPRTGPLPVSASTGFAEPGTIFDDAPVDYARRDVLASRKYRDASFARQVKAAYAGRCAISGLSLTNGYGRPEVEAAHIRPVSDGGADVVRNGLALSGTLHWMFDRGLISVSEDHRILVSHNKVPVETVRRLLAPEQRLLLPEDPRHRPHPDYLSYHREHIFGQVH